jgi:hypothetical protein
VWIAEQPRHPVAGTIYVRRKDSNGRWGNAPICEDCWAKQEPDREPVRVQDEPESIPDLDEEFQHLIEVEFQGLTEDQKMRYRYIFFSGAVEMLGAFVAINDLDREEAAPEIAKVRETLSRNLQIVKDYLDMMHGRTH